MENKIKYDTAFTESFGMDMNLLILYQEGLK